MTRCRCGSDLPGRCPGPANCPNCQPEGQEYPDIDPARTTDSERIEQMSKMRVYMEIPGEGTGFVTCDEGTWEYALPRRAAGERTVYKRFPAESFRQAWDALMEATK